MREKTTALLDTAKKLGISPESLSQYFALKDAEVAAGAPKLKLKPVPAPQQEQARR